eukprot:TRINITY_DN482_c0_g1_i15.p2 TRINITY_DN482_c0_g1~~TRINITY_DN482_c0_g1_i15.p2  ORF type:complete len:113 (-),score=28.03 TRINITY_DN482_c0_g1_i15:601-939(-)
MVQSSQSVNHLKQWYQRRVREQKAEKMRYEEERYHQLLHQAALELLQVTGNEVSDLDPMGSFPLDARTYERFLTARDGDLQKATEMFLNCVRWRLDRKPGHLDESKRFTWVS